MSDTVLVGALKFHNFGTIAQRIKEEIHRRRALDDDFAKKAICSAIQHYRGERFFFNEGTHTMLTVADQGEYGQESSPGSSDGYSGRMVRPDAVVLERSTNWRYTLDRISYNEYVERTSFTASSGYPCEWSWHHQKMFLWPVPTQSNMLVIIDHIKDIGTPAAKYSSAAWEYFDMISGSTITDNWDSDWFKYAEELIRCRAKWDIYLNVLNDVQRAETAKIAELNALDSIRAESDNFQLAGDAVPWGV